MAYPPDLPPTTRTDTTVAAGNHADDHNALAQALADLVEALGPNPTGDDYATLTERLTALEGLVGGSPLAHPGKIIAETVGAHTILPITSSDLTDVTGGAVTFTAPLSGAVWVELEADTRLENTALTGGSILNWGLRVGTTVVVQDAVAATEHYGADGASVSDIHPYTTIPKRFRVTGLTPGASYTWTWGAGINGTAGKVELSSGTMRVVEALGT